MVDRTIIDKNNSHGLVPFVMEQKVTKLVNHKLCKIKTGIPAVRSSSMARDGKKLGVEEFEITVAQDRGA